MGVEYDAKSIIGCGWAANGERMFKVHWLGYDDPADHTWEYEYNLAKCYDLVKEFCDKEPRIGPTSLKRIGGADKSDRTLLFNERNWTTVDVVIEKIHQYASCQSQYNSELRVIESKQFKDDQSEDCLLVTLLESHFYVSLYVNNGEENKAYIADGSNIFFKAEEPSRQLKLKSIFGTRVGPIQVTPIEFNQQNKADHCGASAVMIGLEFIRLYKAKKLDGTKLIVVPKSIRNRLVKVLHPEPSQTIKSGHSIADVPRLVCEYCGIYKLQPGAHRNKLLMHQRSCQKKNCK